MQNAMEWNKMKRRNDGTHTAILAVIYDILFCIYFYDIKHFVAQAAEFN